MEAGKLDRLIRIEQRIAAQSSPGSRETAESWVLLASAWAEVTSEGGDEGNRADQPVALASTVFVFGYRPSLTASEDFRIVHEGRAFNLTDVKDASLERGNCSRREKTLARGYARAEVAL